MAPTQTNVLTRLAGLRQTQWHRRRNTSVVVHTNVECDVDGDVTRHVIHDDDADVTCGAGPDGGWHNDHIIPETQNTTGLYYKCMRVTYCTP